jgi:hypothetical protein
VQTVRTVPTKLKSEPKVCNVAVLFCLSCLVLPVPFCLSRFGCPVSGCPLLAEYTYTIYVYIHKSAKVRAQINERARRRKQEISVRKKSAKWFRRGARKRKREDYKKGVPSSANFYVGTFVKYFSRCFRYRYNVVLVPKVIYHGLKKNNNCTVSVNSGNSGRNVTAICWLK